MIQRNSVSFGLFVDYEINCGTKCVNSLYFNGHNTYFVQTDKSLLLFDGSHLQKSYKTSITVSTQIPDSDLIIGVTPFHSNIVVFAIHNQLRMIIQDIPTNQVGVMHIIYFPKSHSIVTFGSDIKIWNLISDSYSGSHTVVMPTVKIEERCRIQNEIDIWIVNPPCYDIDQELLFLPTASGVMAFDLDGKPQHLITRVPCSRACVYSYFPSKNRQKHGKFLVFDPNDGLALWKKAFSRVSEYTSIGSAIIMISFLDNENVVFVNSRKMVCILNIKTARVFHVHTLSVHPYRVFPLKDKRIAVVLSGKIVFLRANIPWSSWIPISGTPSRIEKAYQYRKASRIIIQTKSSVFQVFSPKFRTQISVILPNERTFSRSYFYDRGVAIQYSYNTNSNSFDASLVKYSDRDQLFVLFESGVIYGYNPTEDTKEVTKLFMKASFMATCFVNDVLSYVLAGDNSEIVLVDYLSLAIYRKYSCYQDTVEGLFFCFNIQLLVIIYSKRTVLFNLNNGLIISTFEIPGTNICSIIGSDLYYGYSTGIVIHIKSIECANDNDITKFKPHNEMITQFSFAQRFLITSSLDCSLAFWNYNDSVLFRVSFPIPLYGCLVLNSKKDVLVATDSELMIVKLENTTLSNIHEMDNVDLDSNNQMNDMLIPQYTIARHNMNFESFMLDQQMSNLNESIEYKIPSKQLEKSIQWNIDEHRDGPRDRTNEKYKNTIDETDSQVKPATCIDSKQEILREMLELTSIKQNKQEKPKIKVDSFSKITNHAQSQTKTIKNEINKGSINNKENEKESSKASPRKIKQKRVPKPPPNITIDPIYIPNPTTITKDNNQTKQNEIETVFDFGPYREQLLQKLSWKLQNEISSDDDKEISLLQGSKQKKLKNINRKRKRKEKPENRKTKDKKESFDVQNTNFIEKNDSVLINKSTNEVEEKCSLQNIEAPALSNNDLDLNTKSSIKPTRSMKKSALPNTPHLEKPSRIRPSNSIESNVVYQFPSKKKLVLPKSASIINQGNKKEIYVVQKPSDFSIQDKSQNNQMMNDIVSSEKPYVDEDNINVDVSDTASSNINTINSIISQSNSSILLPIVSEDDGNQMSIPNQIDSFENSCININSIEASDISYEICQSVSLTETATPKPFFSKRSPRKYLQKANSESLFFTDSRMKTNDSIMISETHKAQMKLKAATQTIPEPDDNSVSQILNLIECIPDERSMTAPHGKRNSYSKPNIVSSSLPSSLTPSNKSPRSSIQYKHFKKKKPELKNFDDLISILSTDK